MPTLPKAIRYKFIFCLILLFPLLGYTQNDLEEELLEAYEDYAAAPRELAYVHLNKSTYIEGEMLGFTAYIFDKFTKERSKMTTNLYCTISDDKGKVLKKKLIYVEDGLATNVFNIDDSLSTGVYTFKAYTNWMRNFKEANHYQQSFKVIDADNNAVINPDKIKSKDIDLQILGEGGHILYGVTNAVAIIAKNDFGYGIAEATGQIKDNEGVIVSDFKLNNVGIAKAAFIPELGKTYSVEINLFDGKVTEPIEDIAPLGLAMTLTELNNKVNIGLQTNTATYETIKDQIYTLALHNGDEMLLTKFKLSKNRTYALAFSADDLYTGINIFTVFDEQNRPLLERLYFNQKGIKQQKVSGSSIKTSKDSLNIALSLDQLKKDSYASLSVSVLPSETKSYNHNHNILSQIYLQPYVNGPIEKAHLYFEDTNRETKYNTDLLMMSQGWSSYNWDEIFNYDDTFSYPFERGIDMVANVNGEKGEGTYIVYPLENTNTKLFELNKGEKEFTAKMMIPTDDDLFRIGYLKNKDKFKNKPSLYLQFYPSTFADYSLSYTTLTESFTKDDFSVSEPMTVNSWNNVEQLDEVVITTDVKQTRAEKLLNKAVESKVSIINENDRLRGQRIDLYLERLGWQTEFDYFSGTLIIRNPKILRGKNIPQVFLDDALLSDFTPLTFLTTEMVDYIESEFRGLGGGFRGQAGFIKIYTDPNGPARKSADNVVTYKVPLTFDSKKTFYMPKYRFYASSFFKEYGTLGWFPELQPNENGKIRLSLFDTKTPEINLYIEGITNDNEFVSEVITLSTKG